MKWLVSLAVVILLSIVAVSSCPAEGAATLDCSAANFARVPDGYKLQCLQQEVTSIQKALTGGQSTNARGYYLTVLSVYNGSQALSACAIGFHMANIFEILDPSSLLYVTDPTMSLTGEDQGQGPPVNQNGWVRTGAPRGIFTPSPGAANCFGYTLSTPIDFGTLISLDTTGSCAQSHFQTPWWCLSAVPCDRPVRVWCVEDLH